MKKFFYIFIFAFFAYQTQAQVIYGLHPLDRCHVATDGTTTSFTEWRLAFNGNTTTFVVGRTDIDNNSYTVPGTGQVVDGPCTNLLPDSLMYDLIPMCVDTFFQQTVAGTATKVGSDSVSFSLTHTVPSLFDGSMTILWDFGVGVYAEDNAAGYNYRGTPDGDYEAWARSYTFQGHQFTVSWNVRIDADTITSLTYNGNIAGGGVDTKQIFRRVYRDGTRTDHDAFGNEISFNKFAYPCQDKPYRKINHLELSQKPGETCSRGYYAETLTSTSKTYDAYTIHSIAYKTISGTVDITTADPDGSTTTYTLPSGSVETATHPIRCNNINTEITIDASSGSVRVSLIK